MHDVVVVGAGASAVAAALQLAHEGLRPVVVDVGHTKAEAGPRVAGNLYQYRAREDSYELIVGSRLQGLSNLLSPRTVPVKLTAPNLAYVTRDATDLAPIDEDGFCAIQSFAAGGLANAWGAGLYRFTDGDLTGFPIRAADLDPYFDRLTAEIGISGTTDDLTPFFGTPAGLQPPLRLSHNVGKLYARYGNRRPRLQAEGIFLGRPHLGVLSQPKDGREAWAYTNTEMWQESPAVYSPTLTLSRLIKEGRVDYRPGILIERWSESADGVHAEGVDLRSGQAVRFTAKALLLAAGAINTAKTALRTFGDHTSHLQLFDNPALQIPLVLPGSIGRPLDINAFGLVQLNLVWDSPGYDARLQGSIMDLTSPARAEFFSHLPYSARQNLALLRYLLPGMIVMQLFFPAAAADAARLSLQPNGRLRIQRRPSTIELTSLRPLFRALRRIGAWTHRALVVQVPAGHAIHYAGTLPMSREPRAYQCDPSGRLSGTRRVYVADSASFPRLPAKNMSFSMMANAMRVASEAGRRARDGP